MPERPTSAAASLYPHLKYGAPDIVERRARNDSVAQAMFPRPQPKPPAQPRLTREQSLDWSDVPPAWARGVGLVRKDGN